MLSVLLFVASVTILCTCVYFDYSEDVYSRELLRKKERKLYLNDSYFRTLQNYRVGGLNVNPQYYPWIAHVLHSHLDSAPYFCTAVCVERDIFITAARCLYRMKVFMTSVMYKKQQLMVKAIVVPSNKSKQLYDDIGIIITKDFEGEWDTIRIYDIPRPDEDFNWFRNLTFKEYDHKVVAYAVSKEFKDTLVSIRSVDLVELDVVVDKDMCPQFLNSEHDINIFDVPCYHSCPSKEIQKGNKICYNYVGVEGGALINKNTNVLFGVATWGSFYYRYELPVGFSVPNSKSYYEDIKCARKIRDNVETNTEGLYQRLCDNKRKYYEY